LLFLVISEQSIVEVTSKTAALSGLNVYLAAVTDQIAAEVILGNILVINALCVEIL
jgi:hypothetical protein